MLSQKVTRGFTHLISRHTPSSIAESVETSSLISKFSKIKLSQSRRFLRGSRYTKVSQAPTDTKKDDNEPEAEVGRGQEQGGPSINRNYGQHQRQEKEHYFNETVSDPILGQPERLPFDRRSAVKKLIKQATSTYGAPIGRGKIGGDQFLTGPYVREAKHTSYDQGNDAAEESVRRKVDPSTTSIILFPGQGTQHVGMCGDPSALPRYVQVLYEIASGILEYDLLDLCVNGPQEKLDQTIHSQPAILVSSLAALEKLRDSDPLSVENCVSTAGFSIGEISALVFAGVISFEDAVRLVKVRAEAMQLAGEITPSGMATILYGADSKLNYSLVVAREWCRREYNIENPVCSIANYLFPHCKVVAGHNEALEFLEQNYKDFNLRRVKRLPVSGAFHTEIMRPAAEPLRTLLKGMTLNRPRMPVFANVSGYRYHSSDELIRLLPQQVFKPVMWEQTVQNIYQRPKDNEYPYSFECGPGSSLTTVLKQVNAKAFRKCKSIQSG